MHLTNVSKPSLTVFAPAAGKNTGAAALVFPGGSYLRLSYTTEGTDVCGWLNSIGMTCVLVKYRVPEDGHYPANVEDLEDAQQAMRIDARACGGVGDRSEEDWGDWVFCGSASGGGA